MLEPSVAAVAIDQKKETAMFKYLSICAALVALGASPLHAQEREAVLQTVEVPGAGFNFVLATPHPEAGVLPDLSNAPEALIVHLPGAKLAVVFEDTEQMVEALESLKRQVGTFQTGDERGRSLQPVVLYVVPKSGTVATIEQMTDTRAGANPPLAVTRVQ